MVSYIINKKITIVNRAKIINLKKYAKRLILMKIEQIVANLIIVV